MLDEVGVIHMNGRIYDAKLGRFLQADPFIQAPLDTQMLNRYSYTRNNPLNATDPSGYFLKDLFKAIFDIIGVVVSIAAGAVCAAAGGPAAGFACASLVQSAFLFASDAIFGGNSSKGFARGSFSSSASPSGFGGGGGRAAGGICTPENGCILNLSGVDADDSPSTFDGQSIVASRLFTYGSLPGSNTEKEVSKIVGQVSASSSTAMTGEKFANGAVTDTYSFALNPPTADEGIHTDVLFYNLSLKPAEAAAILATTGLSPTGLDVSQQTQGLSFLGFLREEGLNVLSRTLTTIGGGGQALLGGALCTTVAGCALGGPLATLGASNIQEGLTGEDGFARNAFQSVLGQNSGDLAFGAVNLGTSIGGLARPVLKQGARPLFRTIPDDFQPAFRQATTTGLAVEGASSILNIYDTLQRSGN